ncbi:AAA family ATPase [uncultured Polaribacter sp.]|uniref:AAA family ATPase n=1 Tax=uncultured Polaribacter sp. TaxID=174711 RepID=UPI0034536DFB
MLKNFRVFKDKTTFQLRPFTILTRPNNSGKSSFIKYLLLLKEGVSLLNFTKGEHNLENYDNVLNWESDSKEIEFETEIENESNVNYTYRLI